jgi:pimeloyl-ACP methyl ester carboxylesterase
VLAPTLILATAILGASECARDRLVREERMIEGPDRADALFTMRVRAAQPTRGAVVLTHGAGSGGSASWDLRADGGSASMLRFLACLGFDAYGFDARGFGGSAMPEAMSKPADASPPIGRAREVVLDLDRVVAHAMKTSSVAKVDLIGWSWGADVAAMYAGDHPRAIDRLVLMAPVYDRRWPARHIRAKAWYAVTKEELAKLYQPEREAREIWDESVSSLFRFTTGGVLRLPAGPYRDLYGADAPVWDARKIVAPVLVVRGDEDKASLEENAYRLFEHLVHARMRRYLVIGGTGHFLFREKRRAELHAALEAFLAERGT